MPGAGCVLQPSGLTCSSSAFALPASHCASCLLPRVPTQSPSAKATPLSRKMLNYLFLPTLIIPTKNPNGLNLGLSFWKCVGSCTCVINAWLRGAVTTHLGLGVPRIWQTSCCPLASEWFGFSYKQAKMHVVWSPWLLPGSQALPVRSPLPHLCSRRAALSPHPGRGQGKRRGP